MNQSAFRNLIDRSELLQDKGIVIGKAGLRDLKGDLYLPKAEIADKPALVIVHGGGWRKGSPNGVRGFGEYLSRSGYVCLCPEYRLSGEAHWPAQIEDVKCAIRFLRAHVKSLGLDPERIGVIGDSAGGHLALMAAVASELDGEGGYESETSSVKAVGSMYGPVRIGTHRRNGSRIELMAPHATESDRAQASPIDYNLSNFPPCLLIHGADDPAVPLSGSIELYTKLTQLNRTVELHVFAGEGHAFDRRSSIKEGMVDIIDPSAINGPIVIELIARFFDKYL